jgi:hypothetical protein
VRLLTPAPAQATGLILGLLLTTAACEVIKPPVVSVQVQATKTTMSPGESVQVTATLTEDGNPLAGVEVIFTSTPVGSFPGGDRKTTDAVGQAATQLRVDSTEVSGDTMVVVTATTQTPAATGSLDILVDVTAGGGTR